METPVKHGMMSTIKNSKGFSLVEMAIVLVIIGIIMAAVIKGQDLMVNARAKQFISAAQSWKIDAFAFMDRNGRFPGDYDKDGNIGSSAIESSLTSTATDEISTSMPQAPANPVVIAGQTFWFYFGFAEKAVGDVRNVITACKSKDCTAAMSADDIEILKAFDTAIDGSANAGQGNVRGLKVALAPSSTVADGTGFAGPLTSSTGNRANGTANIPLASMSSATTIGLDIPWVYDTNAKVYGAVWTFDKGF